MKFNVGDEVICNITSHPDTGKIGVIKAVISGSIYPYDVIFPIPWGTDAFVLKEDELDFAVVTPEPLESWRL